MLGIPSITRIITETQGTVLAPFSLYAMLMIWQLLLIQGLDYMLMIYYFIELLTLLMTTNFYKMT